MFTLLEDYPQGMPVFDYFRKVRARAIHRATRMHGTYNILWAEVPTKAIASVARDRHRDLLRRRQVLNWRTWRISFHRQDAILHHSN